MFVVSMQWQIMADLRQVHKLIEVDYSRYGDHKGAATDQRSASIIVDIGI